MAVKRVLIYIQGGVASLRHRQAQKVRACKQAHALSASFKS